jgi:hypothetical protein
VTDTITTFYNGYLPTVVTVALFTAGSTYGAIVKNIVLVNNGAATTFQFFKNGNTAAHAITPSGWTVSANGMVQLSGETIGFANGDTLYGEAGVANQVTCTIDGDALS